jgi:hypothetical protein
MTMGVGIAVADITMAGAGMAGTMKAENTTKEE